MSALLTLWNIAVLVATAATVWAVVRRPSSRWRTGRFGKAVSVIGALVASFRLGPIQVPAGAMVAALRHRHHRPDHDLVPLADTWPGA